MKASSVLGGNFIKADTVKNEGPQRVVIAAVDVAEFDGKGKKAGKTERKIELEFTDERKLTLNNGNTSTLIDAFGDDTDEWVGKIIVAYHDPSVMYAGKRVGGVKVKVPATRAAAAAQTEPAADPADSDPFA